MSALPGVAIVGAAESDHGSLPDRSELDLHAQAAARALADAGLGRDDVDGLFSASQAFIRSPSQTVAEYLGLRPRWEDSTSVGGSSFEVMVEHALAALQAGRIDVALVTYGSTLRSSLKRGTPPPVLSPFGEQFEAPYGMTLAGAYALAARRHMHEYGTTSEQLAAVAVSMREHAARNPLAMYRDPLTVDDVLASKTIAAPLHALDCCVVSDGGGALVLTREDRARDTRAPVWVLGAAHGTSHQVIGEMPDLTTTVAVDTGRRAFAEAGLGPADVDVALLYDSFTITVVLALEDLGFCAKGEGGALAATGALGIGGSLPTNPDGGGLSSNHPGMRGIFLLVEAARQLRGEGGDRQVPGARVAVAHAVGGVLSSCGTVVLGSDQP